VNHAAFFVSHRLPLALAARESGFDVSLITGLAGSESMEPEAERTLRALGIAHTRVQFTASGMNPIAETRGLAQLVAHMRHLKPDLVHCASPKGILYGAIAGRLAHAHGIVLAISGMGFAFSKGSQTSFVRVVASAIYRALARLAYAHPNKIVIVQNNDDRTQVIGSGLARDDEVVRIPGSGVDLRRLTQASFESKTDMVLFPARMLVEKGVFEFVEAARHLRKTVPNWKFVMAGAADYKNPGSVTAEQLRHFEEEGLIEWRGHVAEMDDLYAKASIVCLPSYYREGMPKSLLEAAAAGCAVVTADTTGCREAIVPGVTGELVPPRDVTSLAIALRELMTNRDKRERYGKAGRQLAIDQFGIAAVVDRTLGIYRRLMNGSAK
jgi:glycosyltransferase involved in cell wall biosynthesis